MAKKARRARKTPTQKRYEKAQKQVASAEKVINQLESEGFTISKAYKEKVLHYKNIKRYTDTSFKQMMAYTKENSIRRFAKKTLNYVHTDKQYDKAGNVILDEHNNAKTFSYNLKMDVTAYKTSDQVARQVYKNVQKIINTKEKTLGIRSKQQKAVRDLLMSMQDFAKASGKDIRLFEGREGRNLTGDVEKLKKQTEGLNWKNFKEVYNVMENMGQWENQADYFLDNSLMHKGRVKKEREKQIQKMRNSFRQNHKIKVNGVERELTDSELDVIYEFFENDPIWQEYRNSNYGLYDMTQILNGAVAIDMDNGLASKKYEKFIDEGGMDYLSEIDEGLKENDIAYALGMIKGLRQLVAKTVTK